MFSIVKLSVLSSICVSLGDSIENLYTGYVLCEKTDDVLSASGGGPSQRGI